VKPSAVGEPADNWKVKSVVNFWILSAEGNHALATWKVELLVVNESAVPVIAALPFKTIEPAEKPLPKATPPPVELMVYVALAVELVVIPEAVAKALIVSVELTVSGPLYCFVDPLTEVPG
jgi:hypothetical protein